MLTIILALAVMVLTAAVYLVAIRAVDLNEKESLWVLLPGFVGGWVVGVIAHSIWDIDLIKISLGVTMGSLVETVIAEVAKGLVILAIFLVLLSRSRRKGWLEFSGGLDGVVYGATVGLGFSVAVIFLYFLRAFSPAASAGLAPSTGILYVFLLEGASGFKEALFAAITGVGFGLASVSKGARRVIYPVLGLVVAIILHTVYLILSSTTLAVTGALGLFLVYGWLVVPAIIFVVGIILGLIHERRAIREQLRDDPNVRAEEYALLLDAIGRRQLYISTFIAGNIQQWRAIKQLHNRQVQLAFAKRRGDQTEVASLRGEIGRIRAQLAELSLAAAS